MTKEIRFNVKVGTECTAQEFRDWIEFVLGYTGVISIENPLCDTELYNAEIDFINII